MKKIFFILILICLVAQPIEAKKKRSRTSRRGTTSVSRTKAQLSQLLNAPDAWYIEEEDVRVNEQGYDNDDGPDINLVVESGNRFRIEGPRYWCGPNYCRKFVVLQIDSERMVAKWVDSGETFHFIAEYW